MKQFYVYYRAALVAADQGELFINLPATCVASNTSTSATAPVAAAGDATSENKLSEREQHKVRVTYTLVKPKAGLRFINPTLPNPYMYSFQVWGANLRVFMRWHIMFPRVACLQATSGSGSVLCGGVGARSWFPCVDTPGVVCPMDNHFTVRSGQLVVYTCANTQA